MYVVVCNSYLTFFYQRRMILAQGKYANSVSGSKQLLYLSFAESRDIFIYRRVYENCDLS